LWQDLSDQIHNFLSDISLADLMSRGPNDGVRVSGLPDAQMVAVRQL
jgi:DNA-binding IscR family transcriptional regulator